MLGVGTEATVGVNAAVCCQNSPETLGAVTGGRSRGHVTKLCVAKQQQQPDEAVLQEVRSGIKAALQRNPTAPVLCASALWRRQRRLKPVGQKAAAQRLSVS